MTFSPTHETALDTLSAQLAQADRTRLLALPQPKRDSLKTHVDGIAECVAIAIIFLEGFDNIADGGALSAKVPQTVQQWVASVPRAQSGTRLAGMVASSTCSVLEDYIADTGRAILVPTELARIRALDSNINAHDAQAIQQLLKKVKPSVKAQGADWVAALVLVFGVTLTPEESDTLIDLITFRNLYIHDPSGAFAQSITGEHIKCWTIAAMILCHRVAMV